MKALGCVLLLLFVAECHGQTCTFKGIGHGIQQIAQQFGHGLVESPRNAVRPHNLAWELPILAGTGILIAKADLPAADRIQSLSLRHTADLWSNIGLGMELGSGTLGWGVGCLKNRSHLEQASFRALAALGAAGTADLVLKLAFDRQFPVSPKSTGKFWAGGRSFPSGHSATSFAFAAAIAHEYPRYRLVKWGAYALAAGVSLSRYPAKRHFPSDILMGGALGYVIGSYLTDH
jgi:membrane-associated phospholipid phosphatase